MRLNGHKALSGMAAAIVSLQLALPAVAADPNYSGYARRMYNHRPITFKEYLRDHPKTRSAVIGAGVGTAAGAVTGLVTGRGVLRGAAIGAGTGAGVGLIRSSETLKRHPILRDVATGTAAGVGLGFAGSRHGSTAVKSAGVGAALGLGVGLLKHL